MSYTFDHKHTFKGLEQFFVALDQFSNSVTAVGSTVSPFPPHNIVKLDDYNYRLELATAGFSQDELEVTLEYRTLTVTGTRKEAPEKRYIWNGIAGRSFKRSFYLPENVIVKSVDLVNGILSLDFEYVLPEDKKPRKLEIGKRQVLAEYQTIEE